MGLMKIITGLTAAGFLSACVGTEGFEGRGFIGTGGIGPDKGTDFGIDRKPLSRLVAGIWIDPAGCQHWIIDDGVEGYLSARMQPDGTPVCDAIAPPGYAIGPFKEGSPISDTL